MSTVIVMDTSTSKQGFLSPGSPKGEEQAIVSGSEES